MLGFDLRGVAKLRVLLDQGQRFEEEFVDLGQVDAGGFGGVHQVRHCLDNRTYAAKMVKIKPSTGRQDNEERLYRLLGQAKAQALLSHPNVLHYHGCWLQLIPRVSPAPGLVRSRSSQQDDFEMLVVDTSQDSTGFVFGSASSEEKSGRVTEMESGAGQYKQAEEEWGSWLQDYQEARVYLLTELCEQNLQSYLSRRNKKCKGQRLSVGQTEAVTKMALQIIAGMAYLHSKRIIHRDIKLHNIMLDSQGNCKIIDFGLAKRVKHWKTSIVEHLPKETEQSSEEEKFSSSVGTKLFSSPEQATSESYDYRTDIYSLGMVIALLFSVFTTAHHERDLLDKMRKRNLDGIVLPLSLKALLVRCLGPEQERPSLAELQRCLKDQLKHLRSQSRIKSVEPQRERSEEKRAQLLMIES